VTAGRDDPATADQECEAASPNAPSSLDAHDVERFIHEDYK
jgi:hypothetical protein